MFNNVLSRLSHTCLIGIFPLRSNRSRSPRSANSIQTSKMQIKTSDSIPKTHRACLYLSSSYSWGLVHASSPTSSKPTNSLLRLPWAHPQGTPSGPKLGVRSPTRVGETCLGPSSLGLAAATIQTSLIASSGVSDFSKLPLRICPVLKVPKFPRFQTGSFYHCKFLDSAKYLNIWAQWPSWSGHSPAFLIGMIWKHLLVWTFYGRSPLEDLLVGSYYCPHHHLLCLVFTLTMVLNPDFQPPS